MYEYKGEDRFVLLEKIFSRIYSKVESEFYLSVLKCEGSKEISNLVEQYATDQYDNSMFCQSGLKIFWEVEAKILVKKGYPKVKDSISWLFRWLQDLNWPGSVGNYRVSTCVYHIKNHYLMCGEYTYSSIS